MPAAADGKSLNFNTRLLYTPAVTTPDRLLLAPSWIAPVAPVNTVLADHAIVINGSQITEICPLQ